MFQRFPQERPSASGEVGLSTVIEANEPPRPRDHMRPQRPTPTPDKSNPLRSYEKRRHLLRIQHVPRFSPHLQQVSAVRLISQGLLLPRVHDDGVSQTNCVITVPVPMTAIRVNLDTPTRPILSISEANLLSQSPDTVDVARYFSAPSPQ